MRDDCGCVEDRDYAAVETQQGKYSVHWEGFMRSIQSMYDRVRRDGALLKVWLSIMRTLTAFVRRSVEKVEPPPSLTASAVAAAKPNLGKGGGWHSVAARAALR